MHFIGIIIHIKQSKFPHFTKSKTQFPCRSKLSTPLTQKGCSPTACFDVFTFSIPQRIGDSINITVNFCISNNCSSRMVVGNKYSPTGTYTRLPKWIPSVGGINWPHCLRGHKFWGLALQLWVVRVNRYRYATQHSNSRIHLRSRSEKRSRTWHLDQKL